MKISLIPINVGLSSVDEVVGLAQFAEASGIESVWTFEHVIVPVDYESTYPYDTSGKMGIPSNTNMLDPLITLATVAQHTTNLKLGTGINILSQTNPLLMAKQAATLDLLSKGRLMLGLGIGWLREEFIAMGVPFEKRGARFDDYIEGMQKIWSGEVVEHQSEFLNWTNFQSYPLPMQSPLPLIIGGSKGKAFDRVAKYGQGWYAPANTPELLEPLLALLKASCEGQQRDFSSIEITAMWDNQGGLDQVKRFQDLGVSRLTVPLYMLGKDPIAGIQLLSDDIISKV